MARPIVRLIAVLIGLAILILVAGYADPNQVWAAMRGIGWIGILAILGIFFAVFAVDSASWQLMLPSIRLDGAWLVRLTMVRTVGEAFNIIVPAGSLGGEPVKAWMLRRLYGIGYREAAALLIMAKTVNLLALIGFGAIGLILIWQEPRLPEAFRLAAAAGLGLLAVGVSGFYAVQHGRAASGLARCAAR